MVARLVKIGLIGAILYAVAASAIYVAQVEMAGHNWGAPMAFRAGAITVGWWLAGLYAALVLGLSLKKEP